MNNDFNNILEILNSPKSPVEYDKDLKHQKQELSLRDNSYTNFLDAYVLDFKLKSWTKWAMKILFFLLIVFGGIFLSFKCFDMVSKMSTQEHISEPTLITAIISSISGVITAVVAIPLSITKYLFNTSEDEKIADIISQMQNHDLESHKIIQNFKQKEE